MFLWMQLGDGGTRRWTFGILDAQMWDFFVQILSKFFVQCPFGRQRRSEQFYANLADILNSEMKENTLVPFPAPQVKSHIIKKELLTLNIPHSSLSIWPSPLSCSSVHTSVSLRSVILPTLLSCAFSRGSWCAGLDVQSCLSHRAVRLVGLWEVNETALTSWRLVCLICISFQNYLSTHRHANKNSALPWLSHRCYANSVLHT